MAFTSATFVNTVILWKNVIIIVNISPRDNVSMDLIISWITKQHDHYNVSKHEIHCNIIIINNQFEIVIQNSFYNLNLELNVIIHLFNGINVLHNRFDQLIIILMKVIVLIFHNAEIMVEKEETTSALTRTPNIKFVFIILLLD